jgi:hypothetical protein
MSKERQREIVIARLIANTRKKKRPHSLVQIARDIRWLERDLGSLKAVSDIPGISISTDMLSQFLSVERLCPQVRKLVSNRKIDLVNVVHYMRNFDSEAQQSIAEEVIAGRLSASDVRALAPLHKAVPDLTTSQLVSRIKESRDIKIYVAYFRIPPRLKNIDSLKIRFGEILGHTEIVSFSAKNLVGTLEMTSVGYKRLREAAKKHNMSVRRFVDVILDDLTN